MTSCMTVHSSDTFNNNIFLRKLQRGKKTIREGDQIFAPVFSSVGSCSRVLTMQCRKNKVNFDKRSLLSEGCCLKGIKQGYELRVGAFLRRSSCMLHDYAMANGWLSQLSGSALAYQFKRGYYELPLWQTCYLEGGKLATLCDSKLKEP